MTLETFPDLGSLGDQELKDLIQQLTDEEQEVSYRRRILHGKIDILRAELVNRLLDERIRGTGVVQPHIGDRPALFLGGLGLDPGPGVGAGTGPGGRHPRR